ncbi:MAG TPA: aquaporin [Candidatus Nanopelagicales bacterium]|nr:aquaporin [Candidatus Nanopelagicales bacterium]
MQTRKLLAEFLGTFFLVLVAVGAAVSGLKSAGVIAVAVAFGFVLIMVAYAFGPVSGAHVNPAVTLAMVLAKRQPVNEAVGYWIAQFLGAIVGAGVLKYLVSSGGVTDQTGALGTNAYDNGAINLQGAFVFEVLATATFVLVILLVTDRFATAAAAGLAIGAALTAIHAFGIPLDGTSVNPARSLGPALFAGGTALSQVWLFILAPLVGGAIAAFVYPLTRSGGEAVGQPDLS